MTKHLLFGNVLRCAARRGIAPFEARARIADFEPSSEDKARAMDRNGPVLITVWDRERTSVIQLFVIRRLSPPGEAVLTLNVEEIRQITAGGRPPLFVTRDELAHPLSLFPGADGHCGIGDLAHRKGEPRSVLRELYSKLVDISRILYNPHDPQSGGLT